MNVERKYVLVSAKWTSELLVFWGSLTKDEDERSYAGYTSDLNSCERYSLDEVKGQFDSLTDRPTFHLKDGGESTFYATEEQLIEMFNQPIRTIMQ